jgi:regulator of cell morphogenesis and NO signaling
MTLTDPGLTIAQIVTQHAAAARVFQKHGIDYCCHGNVTLPEACREHSLQTETVVAELDAALAGAGARPDDDPRALSTASLIARIIDRHHGYLRQALPYIAPIMDKVAKVHGARDESLADLQEAFVELSTSLLPHLDEEEVVLFPALVVRDPDAGVVHRELARMHEDHLAVGDLLARIRTLANGFQPPAWACNTYRVLMAELDGLEADVLRHVHLENHVLAPRFAT